MMNRPTFLLRSLGCKVNQYDGQRIVERLRKFGLAPAGDGAPTLFILNGCAVTARASQKARQTLRAAQRKWPGVKTILCGCEAKRLDGTTETGDGGSAVGAGEPLLSDGTLPPTASDSDWEDLLRELGLLGFPHSNLEALTEMHSRTRAFLKIQDGCDHFCTYCIVPHLRGRETSRPRAEVMEEAVRLAEQGFKEIVITGIHLGRYEHGLVPLIREIQEVPGIGRIRLSSIEVSEIRDDLIEWLATSPKACPHLHIPLQSGSEEILLKMKRPYTAAKFFEIVGAIRERIPLIGISTDVMVGFPGETDSCFEEGLKLVESLRFSRIHVFRYSPRKGTPAAGFPDQVDNRTKAMRSDRVEGAWKAGAENFHCMFIGRTVRVLWEEEKTGVWTGFTDEYVSARLNAQGRTLSNVLSVHRVIDGDFSGIEVSPES